MAQEADAAVNALDVEVEPRAVPKRRLAGDVSPVQPAAHRVELCVDTEVESGPFEQLVVEPEFPSVEDRVPLHELGLDQPVVFVIVLALFVVVVPVAVVVLGHHEAPGVSQVDVVLESV